MIWQTVQWWLNLPSGDQGVDQRENGYAIGTLAYCALADPDATQSNTCKASLVAILPKWTSLKRADIGGTWGSFYLLNPYTSITENGGRGSVCVTQNSTLVTGEACPLTGRLSRTRNRVDIGAFVDLRGESLDHPTYQCGG